MKPIAPMPDLIIPDIKKPAPTELVKGVKQSQSSNDFQDESNKSAKASAQAEVASKASLAKASTTTAKTSTVVNNDSVKTTISTMANVLSFTLSRIEDPAVLKLVAILMKDGHFDSKQLTEKIKLSIKGSGLFYESALFKWVNGEIDLDELRRHPQLQGSMDQVIAKSLLGKGSDHVEPQELIKAYSQGKSIADQKNLIIHQLEMLLSPSIKWEGYLWSNIYANMILSVLNPVMMELAKEKAEEESEAVSSEPVIEANIKLTITGKGVINVHMLLRAFDIKFEMISDTRGLDLQVKAYKKHLEHALKKADFTRIEINHWHEGSNDE